MNRWIVLLAAAAALILGALGIGVAYSTSVPPTEPAPGADWTNIAESVAIPREDASPTTLADTPDTAVAEDRRLRSDFNLDIAAPSGRIPRLSAAAAIASARSLQPSESGQAASVTARLASFTDRGLVELSDAELSAQRVRNRPLKVDAWIVTLHRTSIRLHGPSKTGRVIGNMAVVIDADSGDLIESNSHWPVR